MPATINADNGVVSGSAGVKTTADTSSELALQSNGVTGLTLGTDLVTTLAQPLPVGSGGTGATTSGGALTALGAQATLVSGTTIKTVNSESLLGSGNISIPLTSPAGTTGQVQINNAGVFGAVGSGTAGQVLTSAGAGAPPTFATPSVGAMTLVSTTNASASATVDISFSGSFSQYIVMIHITSISIDGGSFEIRGAFGGNFSSTLAFNPTSFVRFRPSFGPTGEYRDDGRLLANARTSSGYPLVGTVTLYSPANTSKLKGMTFQVSAGNFDNQVSSNSGGGMCEELSAMTGVRFRMDSGNITGTFKLYGVS